MNRNRPWLYFAVSLGAVAAFFVLREHWGHALGLLPYAVLLLCPLMHLFHGHGRHGARMDHKDHAEKSSAQ